MVLAESSWNTGSLWLWRGEDPQAGLTPTSSLVQSLVWDCSAALSANIPGMKAGTFAANCRNCCSMSTAKAPQAGMESSTHTHCRLQLRKNHHKQKNHHQPQDLSSQIPHLLRGIAPSPPLGKRQRASPWAGQCSPAVHINVCTHFSKTLMKWALPACCNSLLFQSTQKITGSLKKILFWYFLRDPLHEEFPPSDCILIAAQIVS